MSGTGRNYLGRVTQWGYLPKPRGAHCWVAWRMTLLTFSGVLPLPYRRSISFRERLLDFTHGETPVFPELLHDLQFDGRKLLLHGIYFK